MKEMASSMAFLNIILLNFSSFFIFYNFYQFKQNYIEYYNIEMLITKKSSSHQIYQQNKQVLSKPKTLISKTLSVHAEVANNTKYLEEDMLNKLLRPPVKKENKGQQRKYDPLFPKPDIQKLIHQNNLLKTQITENSKIIMELRFKVKEQQRKIQKLEQKNSQILKEILEEKNKQSLNKGQDPEKKQSNSELDPEKKDPSLQILKKKYPSIHTQILKKKIHELHTKFIASESQIKRLKKLPSASIYQQNNIQKQHLLAETIRLKSILTSFSGQNIQMENQLSEVKQISTNNGGDVLSSINNTKFQQQFLRMLKQQNEKLKATIRLLQNDKILMKARQTTQNKQNNDLKKQLEHIKHRLTLKQAEIEKLIHENQNLLFKKAAKFRLQKQEKENKLINQLSQTIELQRIKVKKMEEEKQELMNDNKNIKEKQEKKNTQLLQKDKELQKIKIQLSQIKNEYQARIKSLQMNKLHSKQSLFARSSKGKNSQIFRKSLFGNSKYTDNFQQGNSGEDNQRYDGKNEQDKEIDKKGNFNWGKAIKFEQLDICLLKLWAIKQEKIIQKYEDLLHLIPGSTNQSEFSPNYATGYSSNYLMTFEQLYYLLKSSPINLTSKQSVKMAKYIFSDHSQIRKSQTKNSKKKEQPMIQASLALTIIKASINQFTQCLSNQNVINSWKCFASKTKKFIRQLEELNSDTISKDDFLDILLRNRTTALQFQELNFMLLFGFNYVRSGEDIMLDKKKILECLYGLMGDMKYVTCILSKQNFNFGQSLPQGNKKSLQRERKTSIMNNQQRNKNQRETEQKKIKGNASKSILKNAQKCKTMFVNPSKKEEEQFYIKKVITQQDEQLPMNAMRNKQRNKGKETLTLDPLEEDQIGEKLKSRISKQKYGKFMDDSIDYIEKIKGNKQRDRDSFMSSLLENEDRSALALQSDIFEADIGSILADNFDQNQEPNIQEEQERQHEQQNQFSLNNEQEEEYHIDQERSTNQLISQLLGLKMNIYEIKNQSTTKQKK